MLMPAIRSFLFPILLVALLPWGAWLHASAAAAPPLPARSEAQAETVQIRAAQIRCRIGLVPGSSCSWDQAQAMHAAGLDLSRPRPRETAETDLTLSPRHLPETPSDPPRPS
mgnify:CR=1 FL=1